MQKEPFPRYVSTRDAGRRVPFAEALLAGLAPDGGLYVPDRIPAVPAADRRADDGFAALGARVLARWLGGEIAPEALQALTADALDYPVPLVPLAGQGWEQVHVLELFHGPTLSFKDFGARVMARLTAHFLRERAEGLTILVATSGDTGSAVADGFSGLDGIRVVLLYPQGQVSPVQERQLIVRRPGVQTYGVQGTFDDCQRMVKAAFLDPDLAHLLLSSANSINIGRLLPQMLYYHWAAARLGEAAPVFCVPSGNLGNLTGGVLAALSGLPVRRFIAAHNENDFFPLHLNEGLEAFRPSVRTHASAMDVGAPSNFERLRALLPGEAMQARVWGTSVSNDDTLAAMRRVAAETGYLADPHTAVGLEGVRRYRAATGEAAPAVVLATAHPGKFPEIVLQALDREPPMPERLAALWDCDTHVAPLAPTLEALKEKLLIHA